MHLEAPHYNDSLIGSSLLSGIGEVFYLCTLGNTWRVEAFFSFSIQMSCGLTAAAIVEVNLGKMSLGLESRSTRWRRVFWKFKLS